MRKGTRTLIGKTQESPRALMKGTILSYTKLSNTQNSSLTLSKLPAINGAYSCVTYIRLVIKSTGPVMGAHEAMPRSIGLLPDMSPAQRADIRHSWQCDRSCQKICIQGQTSWDPAWGWLTAGRTSHRCSGQGSPLLKRQSSLRQRALQRGMPRPSPGKAGNMHPRSSLSKAAMTRGTCLKERLAEMCVMSTTA